MHEVATAAAPVKVAAAWRDQLSLLGGGLSTAPVMARHRQCGSGSPGGKVAAAWRDNLAASARESR